MFTHNCHCFTHHPHNTGVHKVCSCQPPTVLASCVYLQRVSLQNPGCDGNYGCVSGCWHRIVRQFLPLDLNHYQHNTFINWISLEKFTRHPLDTSISFQWSLLALLCCFLWGGLRSSNGWNDCVLPRVIKSGIQAVQVHQHNRGRHIIPNN